MSRRFVVWLAASLLLAGCSSAAGTAGPSMSPSREYAIVQEAAALLPEDIVAGGTLSVATSPGLVPFTYVAEDGEITGAEIDLMRELAGRLGLGVQLETDTFEGVLEGVDADIYDAGVAGFFDTESRRQAVDFVNYLRGGTQWAAPDGSDAAPDRACGLRVLAIADSLQATDDIPARTAACIRDGRRPLRLLEVESSNEAGALLLRGEADAFVADAPVVAHLVGMSKGRLVTAGAPYDPQTYGIAVNRAAAGLREALDVALQSMLEDGTYARIIGKWGLAESSISLN
ncbi:MAG: transporter substrate-binding domain-containing protein [Actinomycetota bacterium]